ncbi:hypothetical protein [Streptomyces sp. Ru87]|uniref:hypothetical protein n=1 Tax=Streptomyces sp. Ru87 TaxID=2044307 RepID=UPI00211D479D|nr:hypothetical protein [Streptomyces sp. Ru87]
MAPLRHAAPALAGFALVRLTGLLVVANWADGEGEDLWALLATGWDAEWYLGIAEHGYDSEVRAGDRHSNLAFFPLHPAVLSAVGRLLPCSPATAGLVAAVAASVAAAWGVFAVGDTLHGRRTGTVLAVLWGATPVSVVQWMGYTESLFTALAAWSLHGVLTGRWVRAGALAALAGLTRPTGIAVAAAVTVAAAAALWRAHRAKRPESGRAGTEHTGRTGDPSGRAGTGRLRTARPGTAREGTAAAVRPGTRAVLAGGLLAPLGWLGYVGWVGLRLGQWDGYFAVQRDWSNEWDGGARTLEILGHNLTQLDRPFLFLAVVSGTLLLSLLVFLLCLADRQPLALLVFTGALLVIVLGSAGVYSPRARFLLPAFPLLLPAAVAVSRARPAAALLVLAGATAASAYIGGHMLLLYPGAP